MELNSTKRVHANGIAEIIQKFRLIKKAGQIILLSAFERALWNWIECHSLEFAELQLKHNDDLARYCETLFDILEAHVENKKTRTSVWPLQIMLLILSPVRDYPLLWQCA